MQDILGKLAARREWILLQIMNDGKVYTGKELNEKSNLFVNRLHPSLEDLEYHDLIKCIRGSIITYTSTYTITEKGKTLLENINKNLTQEDKNFLTTLKIEVPNAK